LNNPILVSSNVWEFVVVIVDNGNITKFVNDQIYGQHSCSQITTNSISTIHNMYFGVDRDIANYFSGKIDEIGIWNRALTDCEIKNLYNAEVTNSSQTQTALDSYTWPVNNQTYTQSGIYTDTLVNAAGCDSVITLNLSLEYTGIDEHNAVNVLVSPNPITNTFSISGIEQIGSLSLKDLSGILIKSFDVQEKNYSISNVTSGVYFLEVSDEKRTYMIKVVKE
jgi:hypothetical protein